MRVECRCVPEAWPNGIRIRSAFRFSPSPTYLERIIPIYVFEIITL